MKEKAPPKDREIIEKLEQDDAYDEETANLPYPVPNPADALLYHEIMCHIVPILKDPGLLDLPAGVTEPYATECENEYRKYRRLELVKQRKTEPREVKKEKP